MSQKVPAKDALHADHQECKVQGDNMWVPLSGQKPKVVDRSTDHGAYYMHIPREVYLPVRFVVLIHGSLSCPGLEGRAEVQDLIRFWSGWYPIVINVARGNRQRIDFAGREGVVLVAPLFADRTFGGFEGYRGGYRGLFGKYVTADDFLFECLKDASSLFVEADPQFRVWGHSAGGQFCTRLLMRHPGVIHRMVISATGSMPIPDPTKPWPGGMGSPVTYRWASGSPELTMRSHPSDWIRACEVPTLLLEGDQDDILHKHPPPNLSSKIGAWKDAMEQLAQSAHVNFNWSRTIVSGATHDARTTLASAMSFLAEN